MFVSFVSYFHLHHHEKMYPQIVQTNLDVMNICFWI